MRTHTTVWRKRRAWIALKCAQCTWSNATKALQRDRTARPLTLQCYSLSGQQYTTHLAAVQLVGVVQLRQALRCELVTAVNDPPAV